jgi:hypothetical protein
VGADSLLKSVKQMEVSAQNSSICKMLSQVGAAAFYPTEKSGTMCRTRVMMKKSVIIVLSCDLKKI